MLFAIDFPPVPEPVVDQCALDEQWAKSKKEFWHGIRSRYPWSARYPLSVHFSSHRKVPYSPPTKLGESRIGGFCLAVPWSITMPNKLPYCCAYTWLFLERSSLLLQFVQMPRLPEGVLDADSSWKWVIMLELLYQWVLYVVCGHVGWQKRQIFFIWLIISLVRQFEIKQTSCYWQQVLQQSFPITSVRHSRPHSRRSNQPIHQNQNRTSSHKFKVSVLKKYFLAMVLYINVNTTRLM